MKGGDLVEAKGRLSWPKGWSVPLRGGVVEAQAEASIAPASKVRVGRAATPDVLCTSVPKTWQGSVASLRC